MAAQLAIGRGEVFGVDACFADGGHKVGVAYPAWHEVEVDVIGDACSGGVAEVHAEVEAVGAIGFPQGRLGAFGQIHQFVGCLFGRGVEFAYVRVGDDEEMAADVGIDVEDYVVVRGAMEDEFAFVVAV